MGMSVMRVLSTRLLIGLGIVGFGTSADAAQPAMKGGETRMYVASGPLAMPNVPSIKDPAFQAEILAAHNNERRLLGIPDLKWSADLADEAKDWADELASTGQMKHDSQRKHGENLFFNGAGRRTPAQMVQGWLDEKQYYRPGAAMPNVSTTGNWMHVGHYTAVVWSGTSEVGCAVGRGKSSDFLVCRYNPPGNVQGFAAYDVTIAKRAADAAAAAAAAAKSGKKKPNKT